MDHLPPQIQAGKEVLRDIRNGETPKPPQRKEALKDDLGRLTGRHRPSKEIICEVGRYVRMTERELGGAKKMSAGQRALVRIQAALLMQILVVEHEVTEGGITADLARRSASLTNSFRQNQNALMRTMTSLRRSEETDLEAIRAEYKKKKGEE